MGRNIDRAIALVALCLCGSGCATAPDARYVYQDGEYGVIGIPRNSSLGKKDFREQAHHLMIAHFPEGYEVVRAEEVVEGERVFEAARKLELDSEPSLNALNQMLRIGKIARSTAIDQKDTVHITESRIIYRRKPHGRSTGHDGFAAIATASPEYYIDPNQAVRKLESDPLLIAKKNALANARPDDRKLADARAGEKDREKDKGEKPADGPPDGPKDPEVQKASHEGPK